MPIRKALVTAANPRQRTLPLQTLIDQTGESKSALQVILEEAAGAGIEEFCVVVCPGDETAYADACGALRPRVRFVVQKSAQGYGHAILCGREFPIGSSSTPSCGRCFFIAASSSARNC